MPSAPPLGPQPQTVAGSPASLSGPREGASIFPGWRWAAVALAFPLAGLIGRAISGPVDALGPALIGGALTAAGLGAAQWLAAREAFGGAAAWVATSAACYGLGLAAGAALVGYETDLGSLVAMGAVSGVLLGAGQGLVLADQGRRELAIAWGLAMPALFATAWAATTLIGVDVDKQFTVFGAAGAVVFTVLSGLLLARFLPAPERSKETP